MQKCLTKDTGMASDFIADDFWQHAIFMKRFGYQHKHNIYVKKKPLLLPKNRDVLQIEQVEWR